MKIVVAGAGIAGVAIAELLQRFPENEVIVVDAKSQIGAGASMRQHGWFHTGSLYSLQGLGTSVASAVENVKVLTENYGSFFNKASGGANFTSNTEWFRDQPIYYIFPDKLILARAFGSNQPVYQDQSALDNFLNFSQTIVPAEAALGHSLGFDRVLQGLRIASSDRPMRTKEIIRDLLGSFIANGGKIRLAARYVSHRRNSDNSVSVMFDDNSTLRADRFIMSSGKQMASLGLRSYGMSVRHSPIMVVAPAICNDNLVVVEGADRPSFSHIVHSYRGINYSVVSGSYSTGGGCVEDARSAKAYLQAVTASYFPQTFKRRMSRTFFGSKFDKRENGEGGDGYSPLIVDLEEGVTAALPGKFSFAFLLARDLAMKVMNGKTVPVKRLSPTFVHPAVIATPRHEVIAASLLQGSNFACRGESHSVT